MNIPRSEFEFGPRFAQDQRDSSRLHRRGPPGAADSLPMNTAIHPVPSAASTERSRGAVTISTRAGKIIDASDEWLDLFGYAREEIQGLEAEGIFADPAEARDFRQRIEREGSVLESELRMRRKDGSEMICLMRCHAWRAADGSLIGYESIVQDITHQKRIEAALQETQAAYRGLFERSRDAVLIITRDGDLVEINPAGLALFGYPRQDAIGASARSFFLSPQHFSAFQREMGQRGCVSEYRAKFRKRDGSPIDCVISAAAVPSGQRGCTYYQLIVRDVTDTELARTLLRDSEARYRALFEESRDAIVIAAGDGAIIDANQAWLDLFGYQRQELPHITAHVMYPNAKQRLAFEQELERRGSVGEYAVKLMRKDGTEMDCLVTARAIETKDAGRIEYQCSIRDVTARKDAEQTIGSLLRISEKLNSTLDVDRLLDDLVEEAIKLAQAQSGYAGLRTPEGMKCERCVEGSQILPFEYCWPEGSGLPGWLLRNKAPYMTNEAAMDEQITPEIRERFGIKSALSTPILDVQGEVLGFFEVHNKQGPLGFTKYDKARMSAVSQIAATAVQNALAYRRIQGGEEKLRELSGRLLRLQDDERRLISRELHDATGQYMDAVIMNLTIVKRGAAGLDAKAQKALQESLTLMEQCSREVRTLSHLLHPPLLDELGLASALRWHIDGFVERSGIAVDFDLPADLARLPQPIETTLYRLVQECLTNVHRHSGSATAKIRVWQNYQEVILEVSDQGRGMPPEVVAAHGGARTGHGIGILGMQERVKQLGGRLEIESGDHGTTIRATLPLAMVA